jgi:PKD repeat protein
MKKFYLNVMVLFLLTHWASAQENVAPKARVSASPGCSTGPCETLNDLNYGTCGTQQMWINGGQQAGQWILFQWDDPFFFNSMTIHHAQNNTRFLCGFLLQRWENNNWVTHQTITNLTMQCINEIKFDAPFLSDRIRIFNFTHCGSQLSNANFREIEIFAFSADAEARSIQLVTSPGSEACLMGEYPVNVTIRNNGPGFVGPIDIRVEMDGANSFTESVDMLTVAEGSSRTFTLNTKLRPTRLGVANMRATILTPDTDDDNNVVNGSVNVITTPSGSIIRPVLSDYPGFPQQGTFFEKDIITHDKQFIYEITPPSKYSNSSHNTSWTSRFTITQNGSPLAGSRYNYISPSGNSNARVVLNLTEEEVESEIVIRFRVVDVAGNGCDTVATRFIYVAPMPKPEFEGTQVCLGNGLQFVNKSVINSGGMNYRWSFGDGSAVNTQFEPQYVYHNVGTYQVKLIATSLIGFVDSITYVVSVDPTPVPDFSFVNQCGSLPVQFTNVSTILSGNMFYDWSFGDGQSSSELNPSVTYAKAGPYDVTLFIESDNGCFASLTKSAYSYPQPRADFLAPQNVCVGSEIVFMNRTTIDFSSWGSEWFLPNGRTLSRNPTYIFPESGSIPITLKVTSQFGCVDSLTSHVQVIPGPFIQLTHSDICIGSQVVFNSNVNVPHDITADYLWNIDGNILGDARPTVSFTNPGPKPLTVDIAYSNGCKSQLSTQINAGYRPNASFTLPDAVCSGQPFLIENATTIDFGLPQYQWHMGDGSVYTQFVPTHLYNNSVPTPTTVTLIASSNNGACPDTVSMDMVVGVLPTCEFVVEEFYVPGHRGFKFNPVEQNAHFKWFYGDGSVSTESSPIYQYRRDGVFSVRLVATTKEGCECQSTQELNIVNANASAAAFSSQIKWIPNPTSGLVVIDYHGNDHITSVKVINSVGALILETQQRMVDLSSHASGVYTVVTTTESGLTHFQKLVLNK